MLTSCGGGRHIRIFEAAWVGSPAGRPERALAVWPVVTQSSAGGGGGRVVLVCNLSFSCVRVCVTCVYFLETYLLIYHACVCKI